MLTRRSLIRAALTAPLARPAMGAIQPCKLSDFQAMAAGLAAIKAGAGSGPAGSFVPEGTKPTPRPLWSALIQDSAATDAYHQALATAYSQMKKLSANPSDPCGLAQQVWLHWLHCPGASDYSRPDLHATSGFLPWHRAYLYFYERLIQTLSGVPDFRLAVWDWENSGTIPAAYDDSSLFPQFDSACTYSRGVKAVNVPAVSLPGWLQTVNSIAFMGSLYSGGAAVTGPHENVHLSGGGLMRDLSVAAYDPLFFAHHANIDRFWDYWYQRYKDEPGFFDGQEYPSAPWTFYDARTSQWVSVKAQDMFLLDGLGYSYPPPVNVKLFHFAVLHGQPVSDNEFRLLPDETERFRKVIPPTGSFSLPLVTRFEASHEAGVGLRSVLLHLGNRAIPIGEFSPAWMGHSKGAVPAFGSFGRADLELMLAAKQTKFRIETRPPVRGLRVNAFELQYPATPNDWNWILL